MRSPCGPNSACLRSAEAWPQAIINQTPDFTKCSRLSTIARAGHADILERGLLRERGNQAELTAIELEGSRATEVEA